MSECKHEKWIPGKMVDVGDDQMWQEGHMEDTLEMTTITSTNLEEVFCEVCSQCGQVFSTKGITADDIKSRDDGTRMVQSVKGYR